jgi:5-formyltetrahydrofolate cyclo-ligase
VKEISELKPSRWNLREPDALPENVAPLEAVDLLLVPGVAFTRDGRRLGRGGGFYDRLLAEPALRAVKIGICFAPQLVTELPVDPHDRAVDFVVAS